VGLVDNLSWLVSAAPPDSSARLKYFLSFDWNEEPQ
jgi:hypothetical protein